jgi:WD40 repeat protein
MAGTLKLLSCSEGHFWETSEGGPAAVCPVCGGPPESWPLLGPGSDDAPAAVAVPTAQAAPKPTFSRRPVVPGYEIVEDRGRTSAGVAVFLAKQELVPRKVLLKVVTAAEDRGQRAWGALRGEAVALGKIAHPNVIQFYEAGDRNREQFYNAVEFVDGPTLAQKWSAKPLPFRQAAAIVEVLARAVQHAHDQGVVHRSLRPAAIHLQLYKSEGHTGAVVSPFCLVHSMRCIPKITDFGLARRPVEGDVNDLDLQQGMPSYLAPEQVWGRAKDIGPATDVYALGAILYELVGGEPPFLGPSLSETLDLIQSRPLVPPENHRRGVPADLSAVCRKCLEKQPRQRYASAEALADDLRRFLDGKPVKDCPGGVVNKLWRLAWRRPGVLALLACTIGLAIALARVMAKPDHGPQPLPWTTAAPGSGPIRVEVPRHGLIAPAVPPKSDPEAAYLQNVALAQRALRFGNDDRAREYLGRCPRLLRDWEWFALRQQVAHEARERLRTNAPVSGLACSPDGRFLAAVGFDPKGLSGSVTLWDEKGEQVLQTELVASVLSGVAWTADSASLVVLDKTGAETALGLWTAPGPGGVRVRDRQHLTQKYANHRAAAVALRGAGDVRMVAVVEGPQVRIYNRSHAFSTIPARGEDVTALACCPEKNYLATGERTGVVQVWDAGSRVSLVSLEGHTAEVTALAFSPGGKRLVSAGKDGSLCVWDVGGGREVLCFEGLASAPVALAFHPEVRRLFVATGLGIEMWGGVGLWDDKEP